MRRRSVALVAVAVLLSVSTNVQVQEPQEPPLFSTDSELVVLHVTVRDKRGAYVSGLAQDAFGIIEDGRPQTLRFFTDTDTPVTLGLLIDSSASMYANRHLVIAAATAFVGESNPHDEFFALAFNEDVYPALTPSKPFTSDSSVLRDALDRSIAARGQTALYDAIVTGVEYLTGGSRERKVIVVVSDGGDNASHSTLAQALNKARASNAVIYTVALADPAVRDANPRLLKELAESSGGESFRAEEPRDIAEVFSRIARDIRHTYTVGYTSTNTAHDGAFRTVRVVVTAPPGRPLVVRSRTGYQAGTLGQRSRGKGQR